MSIKRAIGAGIAGALALTAIHELARRFSGRAPRMDVLGERALAAGLGRLGLRAPRGRKLYGLALAGDLLSNSLYYALVASGRGAHPWRRGALLGALAGLAAVWLPARLGLARRPRHPARSTEAMTLAWYLAGGLAASAASRVPRRHYV